MSNGAFEFVFVCCVCVGCEERVSSQSCVSSGLPFALVVSVQENAIKYFFFPNKSSIVLFNHQ
jgi:hypothetical protein